MEVTTVSPSPASPTEAVSLCEIDVTNVAIDIVTLLISLCGLVVSGAVLCLLSLKSCNSDIFDLAVGDFLFLLFTVPSILLFMVEDVSCIPIVHLTYLNFLFQLSEISYFWALFQLAYLTFRKDMTFLSQLCYCCHLPKRLWMVVYSAQYWAIFTLFTVLLVLTTVCLYREQEHCRTAVMSMYTIILLLFAAPVVISRTINIIKARCGSKKQQPKRRDIVIFIIILFSLLLVLCDFLQQLGYFLLPTQVFFLLACIHSSIKPFIYFLAGSCWSPCSMGSLRLSLQRVFEDEKKEEIANRNDAPRDTVI